MPKRPRRKRALVILKTDGPDRYPAIANIPQIQLPITPRDEKPPELAGDVEQEPESDIPRVADEDTDGGSPIGAIVCLVREIARTARERS